MQLNLLWLKDRMDVVRRSFREFLAFPSLMIVLFMLLAVGAYMFERSEMTLYSPLRDFLEERVFADAQATSQLLGTIAGSVITVTSITITLMLLILQQTATALSSQVFDQFLRRRSNQVYFGFFIGTALYTLITLATVDEPFNPIFAAALAYLMTVVALYLLIVLFYSTIHQMRPTTIIQAIHDHTQKARRHQQDLVRRTRRSPGMEAPITHQVLASHHGFVTNINLKRLSRAVDEMERACEIVLVVSMGSYVAANDLIAEIKLDQANGMEKIEKMVREAIYLEQSRDPDRDPSYGIDQLHNIAWTVTSTAKSNPAPGLQVVYTLRNMLSQWAVEEAPGQEEEPLPVVYNDQVLAGLMGAFESLAVVASESKEHQILTEILNAFAIPYQRLPEDWAQQVSETVDRILPTFEMHYLTRSLEAAIVGLANALDQRGDISQAVRVRSALERMRVRDTKGALL